MVVLRDNLIKCVVLGDDKVGKTSMLMNYATNRFPSQHVPNMFDNYAGSVTLSGKHYTLQMLDTSELNETDEARRHCYPGADVCVVCFSVVRPESALHVENRWVPEIRRFMGETPFIVVGTQADLRDDESVVNELRTKGQRPMSTREALSFSRRLGAACYVECSPVMKKRLRRVINDAFVSVFSNRNDQSVSGCTIL